MSDTPTRFNRRLTPGFRRGEERKRSGRCSPSPANPCSARLSRHVCSPPVSPARLLNHLICQEEQRWGNRDPKPLSGFEVQDQLELCGLLHGQVRGLGSLQDAIHIVGSTPGHGAITRCIGLETTRFDKHSLHVHRRPPTLCREVYQPCWVLCEARACQDSDAIRTPHARRCERAREIVGPSYLQGMHLET